MVVPQHGTPPYASSICVSFTGYIVMESNTQNASVISRKKST